jgi:hypothetical protein
LSIFTSRAAPTEETKPEKIVAAVDAYESDFSTVKVVHKRRNKAEPSSFGASSLRD